MQKGEFEIEFQPFSIFKFRLLLAFTNFVYKITPKVAKAAKPDSFSYLSHRVKKEREIVVRN